MARQFTEAEIAEAKWAVRLGITVRNDARVLERKTNLTADEVLERVPAELKERYQAGKALYDAGAYRP